MGDAADIKIGIAAQGHDEQAALPPPENSRVVFAIGIPVGLVFAVVELLSSDRLNEYPFAFLLVILAGVGLSLIWNHATTKKLAETAETLRRTIRHEKRAIKETELQNRRLEENNKLVRDRLTNLKKSVDILGGSVQNMATIERKLNEIFQHQELSQEKRRKLNTEQTLFLQKQEEDTLDRERTAIKQRIKDQCEEADTDHDGVIGEGAEVAKLKQFLSDLGIEWSDSFDQDGDGQVHIFEVMESLDKILDAHFSRVKEQLVRRAQLSKELYERSFQLGHVLRV